MWKFLAAMMLAAASAAVPTPLPTEQVFLLRSPGEPALSVRHQPGPGPSVLYIHGATFPAALSMNYRIDGKSWADDLQARGFDVWAFDLPGYGGSERPSSMQLASIARDKVPGRARDVARQIERVVGHIREQTPRARVSIIAHSWGTIPAAIFAGEHADWLDRLVLFGPVARREGRKQLRATVAPARLISASDQWESFQSGVPKGEPSPISRDHFEAWVTSYLATDPASARRRPPSAKVPAGPDVDFDDAWNGRFPYDPARVRTPTLIVRGEWDAVTRDADAAWLLRAMKNVPAGARDVKLARGAHRMHLEQNRQALFGAVGDFLAEDRR